MNVVEFLKDNGVRIWSPGEHHHVTKNYIGFDCPFCSPNSGRVRAGYHTAKHFVTCWKCGGHSIGSTLAELTGKSRQECLKALDPYFLDYQDQPSVRGKLEIPTGVGPLLPAHVRYLKGRGFDPDELVEIWKIGGIGNHPTLPWRIFIPIHHNGDTVSWTTRTISKDPSVVRYRSAKAEQEKLSAKAVLYGLDLVQGHSVIVHEGPTDVWRTGPGSVATLGTAYTTAQVLKLTKFINITVVFDAEYEAQKRASRLCAELALFSTQVSNVVLDAKDPGCADKRETRRLRRLLV